MRWSALILYMFASSVVAANLGTPRIVPEGGSLDYLSADTFWCNDPTQLISVKEKTINLREENNIDHVLSVMRAKDCGVTDVDTIVRVKQIVEGYFIDKELGVVPEIIVGIQIEDRFIWAEASRLVYSGENYAVIKQRMFNNLNRGVEVKPINAVKIIP